MKKILLAFCVVLSGIALGEMKPEGTILSQLCGTNSLELVPGAKKFVNQVCWAGAKVEGDDVKLLTVDFTGDAPKEHLLVTEVTPDESEGAQPDTFTVTVIRVAPDSKDPKYTTVRLERIQVVGKIVDNDFDEISSISGTIGGLPFQVGSTQKQFHTQ